MTWCTRIPHRRRRRTNDNEVSFDLADVLNALGAQDWELTSAVPLKDSDPLLLILSREKQLETAP